MSSDPRELAQRITDAIWDKCCSPPDEGFDTKQAIIEIAAILAAEMPRWVPVSEKFPRDFERVICFDETAVRDQLVPEIEIRYEVSSYSGHFWNCGHLSNVTHWQYLPSPPREEAK